MTDSFHDNLDPKARRIDSRDTFRTEIILTPEFQRKLARQANPDCIICCGKGYFDNAAGDFKFCDCIESRD